MDKVVVVGQGYVGLPLAVRAAEVGFRVVGFDVDEFRVKRLASGESFASDLSNDRLASVLDSGRYTVTTEPKKLCRLRLRRYLGSHAAEGRSSRPLLHRGRVRPTRSLHPARIDRRAGVVDLPGHDRGASSRPILEDGSGLTAGEDFFLGYSPERIDPGNTTWTLVNTPKIVSGINAASLTPRRPVLPTAREAHGPRVATGRSRAGQAAREHLPAREHRARQRDGHVRPRARHRHLGRARRGGDQALRLHAVRPRPGGGRALPARRPLVPVVARPLHARPPVTFHRAGQRHQHGHAHLRRQPSGARAQRAVAVRSRTGTSCFSGCRTRRTPAMPASRRPGPSPAGSSPWAPTSRAADPCLLEADVPPGVGLVDLTDAELAEGGRGRAARGPRPVRPRPRSRTTAASSSTVVGSSVAPTSRSCESRSARPSSTGEAGRMHTTYCGHASFRMAHGGVSVLVDPWLSATRCVPRVMVPVPGQQRARPGRASRQRFVLISHDHQDHFDLDFLRTLSARHRRWWSRATATRTSPTPFGGSCRTG